MAGRIAKVRGELRAALEKRMADKDWSFVTKQIGMFSYTGMTPQQVGACLACVCACCVWRRNVCVCVHLCCARMRARTLLCTRVRVGMVGCGSRHSSAVAPNRDPKP
jgi:hypothetical protein